MATDKGILLDTSQLKTRRRLYKAIRALPAGLWSVEISRKRATTSTLQRGYYWGYLLVEVARLLGVDREKADKVLCSLFLSSYVEVAGKPLAVVGSTASLDGFELLRESAGLGAARIRDKVSRA
ncbi:hypothetical protein IC229_18430 [Spirosoma sp. BT702]|uniref:Uncharacterized protein n=1 Tax=Spirosoma profusum TaxID=2771354 RepID=A0A927AT53_9BACT|nr:hypothetical protein [Spirosoma profusum]MBD2702630.1 hypothetical protein [Spirosoma profusum]